METISTFVEAFHQDRYRYTTIEKEIEATCKAALQGIDCLWQSRVKAAKSLENKLKARSENYKDESANVADACDLVAGRIILARWVDFSKVEKIIETNFHVVNRSQHPKHGQDIGNLHSRFRGYDGLHFYVKRHFSADKYLQDLVIEIQVMSAFMWAFSILDHDITYKKLSGEPEENVLQSLDLLKGIANLGEISLQIFDAQFLSAAKLSPRQPDITSELQATVRVVAGEVNFEEDDRQCLRNLRLTDPRDDKSRIELGKDRLLESSCSWILEDPAFIDWWTRDHSRLLWIHGDPGKGKTMMMVALISEIGSRLRSLDGTNILTYFFCENTNSDLNTTVSVLRGLIFLLIDQEKALVCHLRKRYDVTGKRMFEELNTQYALLDVLLNILKDPRLGHVCLMIDALDECDGKIYQLLEWIIEENADMSPKIKWLVTSRNEPAFIERLGHGKQLHTSLEMNSSHVTHAVCSFIDYKVTELARLKLYDSNLQAFIRDSLLEKAEGTFLWVALVCKELKKARRGREKSFLQATPAGLVPLYERMLNQVLDQEDANDTESCRRILCSVILAFRPLHLKEIAVFAKITESDVEGLVDFCGSFISVREQTVYLIHQSAKDYLGDRNRNNVFPLGREDEHANTVSLCLEIMSASLRSDICNLKDPGTRRDDIHENVLRAYIPFHVQYACMYWIGHLQQASHTEQESLFTHVNCQAFEFFRYHFLHWIETLGLLGRISEAILSIISLCSLPRLRMSNDISLFVRDARRFTLEFRSVIDSSPLQIYVSALMFSPETSTVKRFFSDQIPRWIECRPRVEKEWDSTLQILEGHSNQVNVIAFSPNGQLLASGSVDQTVKIWDPTTGDLRSTLSGHEYGVERIAFSPDSQLLAATSNRNIRLWNPLTGRCRNTLEIINPLSPIAFSPDGRLFVFSPEPDYIDLWDLVTEDLQGRIPYAGDLRAITFSPNGQLLASGTRYWYIGLWDPITGTSLGRLTGLRHELRQLVFSPDGNLLAAAGDHNTIALWDLITKQLRCKFEGTSVAFSPSGRLLASGAKDNTVKLWDTCSYDLQGILEGHSEAVNTVVFSPDGNLIASASDDKTVRLWDPNAKVLRNVFQGHNEEVKMALFSPNGLLLASASSDNTVRLLDLDAQNSQITSKDHSDKVNVVAFSSDKRLLASASNNTTIKIWDPITGHILNTLEGHRNKVNDLVFSCDNRLLASASGDSLMDWVHRDDDFSVRLWDPISGEPRGKFDGHTEMVNTIAFSPNGEYLASGSGSLEGLGGSAGTIRLWDLSTGECRGILRGHPYPIRKVVFSPDGQLLASVSIDDDLNISTDKIIRLWNPITSDSQGVLEGHSKVITALAFSPNSHLLVSASRDNTIRLWDVTKRILLQQIQHQETRNISFRENGSQLLLDGRVFQVSSSSCTISLQEQNSADDSYSVSNGDRWVCWRGRNIVYLPFRYIPSACALRDNMLAIGSKDGGVIVIIFSQKIFPP